MPKITIIIEDDAGVTAAHAFSMEPSHLQAALLGYIGDPSIDAGEDANGLPRIKDRAWAVEAFAKDSMSRLAGHASHQLEELAELNATAPAVIYTQLAAAPIAEAPAAASVAEVKQETPPDGNGNLDEDYVPGGPKP